VVVCPAAIENESEGITKGKKGRPLVLITLSAVTI
jgi:hypothetical protein